MTVHAKPVLELGDPRLRTVSQPVQDVRAPEHRAAARDLADTLEVFRREHGFGRAVSAPQIGVMQRFIACNLQGRAFVIANPEIVWRSRETFTMWDDCMSFPSLMVRVRRHESISLRYLDEQGGWQTWSDIDRATSELLQHEIDHLDGVLALDRAIDSDSIITRTSFARDRARFEQLVEYVIAPPQP